MIRLYQPIVIEHSDLQRAHLFESVLILIVLGKSEEQNADLIVDFTNGMADGF